MSRGTEPPVYPLGHSERELERLRVQARLVDPITRRFLVEAGVGPGMRVLDVGTGVGDVAFLAAELVGEGGSVVGADRSADALGVARRRATELGLSNVTFVEGDPAELTFEGSFDAVVGRYVLHFQPDPAVLLRKVAAHGRPGGLVVFHEPFRGGARSFPPVRAYDEAWELIDTTVGRQGVDVQLGIKLHSVFLNAGLPAPSMRLESVIAGGSNARDLVHFEMDLVPTLLPEMERLGIATAEEIDAERLADRVFDEVAATNSVIVGRAEIGAWSSIPGG